MNKKEYKKPSMKVVEIDSNDIICTSGISTMSLNEDVVSTKRAQVSLATSGALSGNQRPPSIMPHTGLLLRPVHVFYYDQRLSSIKPLKRISGMNFSANRVQIYIPTKFNYL